MLILLFSQAEPNVDGEDLMGRQTPLLLAVKGGHTGSARSLKHFIPVLFSVILNNFPRA